MNPVTLPPSLLATANAPLPKDLEGACRALEKEFVTLVFRKMREAMVPKSSDGSAGFARETTQGMLDAQWAELASRGEGLGLWRVLYRQLESRSVKSESGAADENGRGEAHRKEAVTHAYAKGSAGTLGQRFGSPQADRAPEAHQGLPGLPRPAKLGPPPTGPAEGKGL